MISTEDLVNFMMAEFYNHENPIVTDYKNEIVARLERYDEMKEGIEKMIGDCRDSSGVDK
jgi:hypothetical protein